MLGARDPDEFGKKAKRHQLPIEDKESFKWLKSYWAAAGVQARCPDTTIVSVGDREANIYELFQEASADPTGPKLLVRAMQNRVLQDEQHRLWETMQALRLAAMQALQVPVKATGRRAPRIWRSGMPRSIWKPPRKKVVRPLPCGLSWRRNRRPRPG